MMAPQRIWMGLLPLLLLLTAIVTPRLGWDGLWYDELFSVANAGGAPYDPALGPAGIYERVLSEDPYQALGYPYVLAVWGNLVGWSEVVTRWFSLLLGLVAVALTYQLGRSVVSAAVGVLAAALLSVSSFFVLYTHEVRAFTLVAVLATCFLWSYIRLVQQRGRSPWAALGFVISGAGLLYAHYAAAMLLVGVGLYHVFFAPKNRRWLEIVGLALIVSVLFLPQVPAFLAGYGSYTPEGVDQAPLNALSVVTNLAHFFSNGLLPALVIVLLAGVWLARRQAALRIVIGVIGLSGAVLLLTNEALAILEPPRLRYAMFMWPGLAVWSAAGLVAISDGTRAWLAQRGVGQVPRRLAWWAGPLLWVGVGLVALYQPGFTAAIEGDGVPRLREVATVLQTDGTADDLFAFYNGTPQQAWYIRHGLDYITYDLAMPFIFTATLFDQASASNRAWAAERLIAAERVWYSMNRTIPVVAVHEAFLNYIADAGFVSCGEYVNLPDINLSLYARSAAYCMADEPIVAFGADVELLGYEMQHDAGALTVALGWAAEPTFVPERYSAGVYVMPADEVNLLAQGAAGFGNQRYDAQTVHVDTADLAAGTYDVWLAVYEWQTGQRLPLPTEDDLIHLGVFTR